MDAPKLKENECSVLIAEYSTGHVYKKDLTIFLDGEDENEIFQIFENFDKAKKFVLNFVDTNSEFECVIYDYAGEHLFTCDKNGERR